MSSGDTSITPDTLGERIAALREGAGWTQRDLADEADLSVTFISQVENNKRNIGSEGLLRIANALNASLDFLLRGKGGGEEAFRKPISIPPELAQRAEEKEWPLSEITTLIKAHDSLIARRSRRSGALKRWSMNDWDELHHKIFGD